MRQVSTPRKPRHLAQRLFDAPALNRAMCTTCGKAGNEPTKARPSVFFFASPHTLQQRKDWAGFLVGTDICVAFRATQSVRGIRERGAKKGGPFTRYGSAHIHCAGACLSGSRPCAALGGGGAHPPPSAFAIPAPFICAPRSAHIGAVPLGSLPHSGSPLPR
jgi:hypothetical protein